MAAYATEMWDLAMAGNVQGIWFWAGVYCLLMCIYSAVYQMRVRRWPSVRGTLHNVSIEKFGSTAPVMSEQDHQLAAHYRYEVAGITYEGDRVSSWVIVASTNLRVLLQRQLNRIQVYPPDGVDVYYNPARPAKSYLLPPGNLGLCLTLVLAVLPLLLYVYRYHAQ